MTSAIISSVDSSQDISAKIEQATLHSSKRTSSVTSSCTANQRNMQRRTYGETLYHEHDANSGHGNNHVKNIPIYNNFIPTESNDIKMPATPRTNSPTTLSLPLSDEPFQFDSDSRCASFRSLNSTSETENPYIMEPSKKNISDEGNSNKCHGKDSTVPAILAPALKFDDRIQTQNYEKLEYTLSSPLDQDPSMGSSVSSSFNSTNAVRRSVSLNPPSYVDSTSSSVVSPISYSVPAMQKSRVRSGRRVKPVVYSAIGSLESVNQNSLGSFNHRVTMAATLNKVKREK
jgi:hypothetical protein